MKNFKMYYEKQLGSYTIYLLRHKKKVWGKKVQFIFQISKLPGMTPPFTCLKN